MEIKRLLVTTDLSDKSAEVFDLAAYEAKMKGAEVDLVHVLSPTTAYYYPSGLEMGYENVIAEYREHEKATVHKKMEEFIEKKFHGVKVNISVIEFGGSEGELIAEHAKKTKADAIMIASAGRGVLGQVFTGSTVMRVLQNAECPVIVVPVHN